MKVIGLTVDMHQGNEKSLNHSVQELKHGAENENKKSTLNKMSRGGVISAVLKTQLLPLIIKKCIVYSAFMLVNTADCYICGYKV